MNRKRKSKLSATDASEDPFSWVVNDTFVPPATSQDSHLNSADYKIRTLPNRTAGNYRYFPTEAKIPPLIATQLSSHPVMADAKSNSQQPGRHHKSLEYLNEDPSSLNMSLQYTLPQVQIKEETPRIVAKVEDFEMTSTSTQALTKPSTECGEADEKANCSLCCHFPVTHRCLHKIVGSVLILLALAALSIQAVVVNVFLNQFTIASSVLQIIAGLCSLLAGFINSSPFLLTSCIFSCCNLVLLVFSCANETVFVM